MLDIHPPNLPAPDYPLWLYRAVHAGNPGDAEYYRRLCAGAGSVLEIGCGTGRIGGQLVGDGIAVTGLDISSGAVEAARSAGVDAFEADMRAFDLGRVFDRVIAPYNVLYCALTEDDLVASLRCIRAHLAPDGEFAFDVYCADSLLYGFDLMCLDRKASPLVEIEAEPIMTVKAANRSWNVFEDSYWWPHEQRIDAYFRHVAKDDGETIVVNIPQRYLLSGELVSLLARADLMMSAWGGDFEQSVFGPESDLMVVRAMATA